MTEEKRYAILDTDFVSKTTIIQASPEKVLAARVLAFPEYEFYCHKMMVEELGRHGTRKAQEWLQNKIKSGIVHQYGDTDILDMLEFEVGMQCYSMYLIFLKMSCDIYDKGYFEKKFAALHVIPEEQLSKQRFLETLEMCDKKIGVGQSLGEKKACVLLQALRFIKGEKVFLFCSDDFGARRGFADGVGIPCIGVIAVFMKLKNMGMSKEEAGRYFQSFVSWCNHHKQTQLYVWEFHGTKRRVKKDFQDVFDGLYEEVFDLMKNGDLLIKPLCAHK